MTELITPDEMIERIHDHEYYTVDNVSEAYREFREEEGIPVHGGIYVRDLEELEVGPWDRTGQQGALVNLFGGGGVIDLHVHQLDPGGETTRQHHAYDEVVYAPSGNGVTVIGEGDNEVVFEWSDHSVFCIPACVPYRHVNVSDDSPARLVASTPLPLLLQTYRRKQYMFDTDYDFWETAYDEDFFSAEGTVFHGGYDKKEYMKDKDRFYWEANFIPDIRKFDELAEWGERGPGNTTTFFPFQHSSMHGHISEFPIGTYKKAHRHGPGAHITILSGTGFSLLWYRNIDGICKVDWEPGSVFAPATLWYHQHINTSPENARYWVFHAPRLGGVSTAPDLKGSGNPEENTIEYCEEDPIVRETFEEDLRENGIESRMPEEAYTDPDHEFNQS